MYQQSNGTEYDNKNHAAVEKLARLPFKRITIEPSVELRARIVVLAEKMKISAKASLARLLAAAADVQIPWLLVQPINGSEAGVSLAEVERVLLKVFNLLGRCAGQSYRDQEHEAAKQINSLRDGAVELWCAAQKLAKETFYDPQEFRIMCDCYRTLEGIINNLRKNIRDEQAKEKPDGSSLSTLESRVAAYETIRRVLRRLGCGGGQNAL